MRNPHRTVVWRVAMGSNEPVEHLVLWLMTTVDSTFARLAVGAAARERGVADPARRWAGAALHSAGTLAYLATRPRGGHAMELGVIAHGPDSRRLAAQTVEHLRLWDRQRPAQPTITAHAAGTLDDRPAPGYRIDRPDTRLTIDW